MYADQYNYRNWADAQAGQQELFPLNESERLFKQFYQEHKMDFLGNALDFSQYETLLNHYPNLPDFRRNIGNFSSEIGMAGDGLNVKVSREERYVYSIKHKHSYIELHYAFHGNCRHYINDEMLIQKAGEVYILSPYAWHSTALVEDDSICFNIFVDRSFFEQDFLLSGERGNCLSKFIKECFTGEEASIYMKFSTGEAAPLNRLVLDMYKESDRPKAYSREMMKLYLNQLLITLLRDYSQDMVVPEPVKVKIYGNLTEILDYIQIHYAQVTLSELSEKFNYNKEYLSRCMKVCTGKTFSELALIENLPEKLHIQQNLIFNCRKAVKKSVFL